MAPPAHIETLPETDTTTFTVPDRATIQSIAKRRAASGRLVAGVAAVADVESFKGRTQHSHKPKARRWDHRLNIETQSRKHNKLKEAAAFLKTPGLISLGGGLPSSEYFPFAEIDVKVPRIGGGFSEAEVDEAGEWVRTRKHDIAEGKSDFDIATAFNYGQGHGAAQFLRFLIEHTELVHDPPYRDWSCTMSIGSTSATDMAFRMFCKPGDWLLTEEYTFPAMLECAAPMGIRVAAVKMDEQGLLANSLDDVLSNWDTTVRGGPKPFLLYIVPTGQNPTGATMGAQRRKEVYAVAQKHDLIILEDEPYYFLQMQPYREGDTPDSLPPPPTSHDDFLRALVPSFLSLDTDGRVVRMDSFSKVLAPGTRVGWITATEQICERYRTHADVSTQGPSGVSQLLLFKLLEDHWGHAGYLDWLVNLRIEYTRRRNAILAACKRHLPQSVVRWVAPMAGMFHWLEIDWRAHPDYPNKKFADIEDEIFHSNIQHGTLLMKGSWFTAEPAAEGEQGQKMFFRATYAAAPFDLVDEAIRRFGESVRTSFRLAEATNGHAVNGHADHANGHHVNGVANGKH